MLRQVTVETGVVAGIPASDPRITVFKGIPFAAPPVGELRFAPPKPARKWDGVKSCDAFGPMSMQRKQIIGGKTLYEREWLCMPDAPMSEDCLTLNVWTPAISADEKLPVLVWYFGGALQMGSPNEMEFDGERISRRGVIVVTVNYRTNAFGFLCHPEITKENPDAPANFGNLDQQAGTNWVKRNIAAFGGDPNRITIAGQSAGGGSVMTQLTSPQNGGFCQAAIIESGAFVACYRSRFPQRTLAEAEKHGEDFFAFLGVKTLKEARRLDAEYIRDKVLEYDDHFGTVEDGLFHLGDNLGNMLRGECLDVPIMIGMTSSEFFDQMDADSREAFVQNATILFGDQADAFMKLCEAETLDEMIGKSCVSTVDIAKRALCEARAKRGQKSYYYIFDATIPGPDDPGTFHSVDLWFFFETLNKCWRPFVGKHYDLARQMCNYWAEFIKEGDPNGLDGDGSAMPYWPEYGRQDITMVFADTAKAAAMKPTPLTRFWMDRISQR